MVKLGVNIDHVATLRQARQGREPDPVWAAAEAELAGADGITLHLREDRRHIQDRDAQLLRRTVQGKYNLEMAAVDEIVDIACDLHPDQVTLVPERRTEVTTEGGLDVRGNFGRLTQVVRRLQAEGIEVSLFVDPDLDQLRACLETGAPTVEIHTGRYAEACGSEQARQLGALHEVGAFARGHQLTLNFGHGLNYSNVGLVAAIAGTNELNIGHSIICRALFTGMREAVRTMKQLIVQPVG